MTTTLSAGERVRLTKEDSFAIIISGAAEVYAVSSDKNKFRQTFLMKLKEGEAAFPAIDEFSEIDTEIYALSDLTLQENYFENINSNILQNLMLDWFEKLVKIPKFALQADMNDDVLRAWQKREVFKLNPKSPIKETLSIFKYNQEIFSMLIGVWFDAEDNISRNRREMRLRQAERLEASSVDAILNVNRPYYEESGDAKEIKTSMSFVLRLARKALNLPNTEINLSPNTITKLDNISLLRRMAEKGNIALRFVTLEKDWHKKDCGVILGYFGKNKEIAAFLPQNPKSYKMFSKVYPEGVAITEKIAKEIDNDAFLCYAGLPKTKLETSDLRKFILRQCFKEDFKTILLTSFLLGLLPLIAPIVTETIFRDIVPIFDRQGLVTITQTLFVTGFTIVTLSLVRSAATFRISTSAVMALEASLWMRLLSLPEKFFSRFTVGELASRMRCVEDIKRILNDNFISAASGVLFGFWTIFLMFFYSPSLTTAAIAVWLLWSFLTLFFFRRIISIQKNFIKARGALTGKIQEIFSGISTFKTYGAEEVAYNIWSKIFGKTYKYGFALRREENYIAVINTVQPFILSILIYYMAIDPIDGQIIDLPKFIAFEAAYIAFNAALTSAIPAISKIFTIKPFLETLAPILEEIPETTEDKTEADALSGAFEVSNLTFSYSDGKEVLKNISFRVKAGENLAIVGKSGCGKSTLVKLLLGFEKPKSGTIFFDGQSLEELSPPSVRSQMGVVLQNGKLMTGDIFSNIAGQKILSEEDAWEAAEQAGIAKDIEKMPMKMQTIVTEGGGNLSGGQRQRLLIARAIAAKPAILIFDEATSALDNRAQAIVVKSLEKLKVTRITIAHRLSTVKNADRILVLDDGEIKESGNFNELMEKNGFFAKLAKRQIV